MLHFKHVNNSICFNKTIFMLKVKQTLICRIGALDCKLFRASMCLYSKLPQQSSSHAIMIQIIFQVPINIFTSFSHSSKGWQHNLPPPTPSFFPCWLLQGATMLLLLFLVTADNRYKSCTVSLLLLLCAPVVFPSTIPLQFVYSAG